MPSESPVASRPRKVPRGRLFVIGREPGRRTALIIAVTAFSCLLLLWWLVTHFGVLKPIFLPTPQAVGKRLIALWQNGLLWSDLKVSLYRILMAFLISSLMAITVGVFAGCYGFFKALVEPLVDFVRYMPVVAFVPMTILWFGTDDLQKFIIIWIGTFFQQVLMVIDAIKRVPHDFVGLGRTLGLPDRLILWRIVLPSAWPAIWDALRITLGWAWTWLVLAELIGATSGLGYRIEISRRFYQTDTIIAYILLLGLLGLVTDQLMRAAARIMFRYNNRRR